MTHWFDREEECLAQDYADGLLSTTEYNLEMRNLQRDYQAAAEEEAERASEEIMESYGLGRW